MYKTKVLGIGAAAIIFIAVLIVAQSMVRQEQSRAFSKKVAAIQKDSQLSKSDKLAALIQLGDEAEYLLSHRPILNINLTTTSAADYFDSYCTNLIYGSGDSFTSLDVSYTFDAMGFEGDLWQYSNTLYAVRLLAIDMAAYMGCTW